MVCDNEISELAEIPVPLRLTVDVAGLPVVLMVKVPVKDFACVGVKLRPMEQLVAGDIIAPLHPLLSENALLLDVTLFTVTMVFPALLTTTF